MKFDGIHLIAPEDSPNTDGIHIGESTNIDISTSVIATGDDCVSLSPGCSSINVTNVRCGPGHGISVGSLGRMANEEDVSGLTVTNCTFTGTQNGLRVKTWASSFASNVFDLTFQHIHMENVYNPIIIDQQYCPYDNCQKVLSCLIIIPFELVIPSSFLTKKKKKKHPQVSNPNNCGHKLTIFFLKKKFGLNK
jgi:galacturan 1,4-alpha-galacturonidase